MGEKQLVPVRKNRAAERRRKYLESKPLRRYTNLVCAIHLLRNKRLTLVNPNKWDDKIDSFFMEEFRQRIDAASVLALCFTKTKETYHHWRVFGYGLDGICIEFNRKKLVESFQGYEGIKFGDIEYIRLSKMLMKKGLPTERLPFVKRFQYEDDSEFRIIFVDKMESKDFVEISIDCSSINKIILSPWVTKALAEPVRECIHCIDGCADLDIRRSTAIESEHWKKVAKPTHEVLL